MVPILLFTLLPSGSAGKFFFFGRFVFLD
jgi:hypothetical protein